MAQSTNDLTLRAANFLVQALGVSERPEQLATELQQIDRDLHTAVYALQLGSTVGPAAFLVYAYEATIIGSDGQSGQTRFDTDLVTLQQSQARDTPGPRLLASGEIENTLFILATDPQTFEALAGEGTQATGAEVVDPPLTDEPAVVRRQSASELLRLLREAEGQAALWLAAVRADERTTADDDDSAAHANQTGDELLFDDVETELALFLLGNNGIQQLLHVINVFLAAAQARAAQRGDHRSGDTGAGEE